MSCYFSNSRDQIVVNGGNDFGKESYDTGECLEDWVAEGLVLEVEEENDSGSEYKHEERESQGSGYVQKRALIDNSGEWETGSMGQVEKNLKPLQSLKSPQGILDWLILPQGETRSHEKLTDICRLHEYLR